jgi:hypothetical protein
MILSADEFLRRFLLHVLPGGFGGIRHFGFLPNRGRTGKLARCRALLAAVPPEPAAPTAPHTPPFAEARQAVALPARRRPAAPLPPGRLLSRKCRESPSIAPRVPIQSP